MASLSIRRLDDEDFKNLRIQAAKHGVSMEEEVRQIIKRSISSPKKITLVFQKHFGAAHGIDVTLDSNREPHNPIDFEE